MDNTLLMHYNLLVDFITLCVGNTSAWVSTKECYRHTKLTLSYLELMCDEFDTLELNHDLSMIRLVKGRTQPE